MRYKDDADAAVTQFPACFHELRYFLLAQRGGRLVHNNHFCVDQNRLGDFDHLLHAHTKGACRLFRVNILSQRRHDFLCLFVHGLIIKQTARSLDPLVDKDIICDAEQFFYVQLLIHAGNACRCGFIWIFKRLFLAVDVDFSFIRLMHSRQHLNQCRFSRTIFSDQSENFARLDRQLHVIKSYYTWEYLRRIF